MTSANPVTMPLKDYAVQHVRLAVMETEDFVRAFRAFADKRKPVFEGN
jgi:enoyl-CoA hydratase/carnithine racemase